MPKPRVEENQEFVGPRPFESPLPKYPESVLSEQLPPITVTLRILVDSDGTVREVIDSPLEDSTMHAFVADFRDAAASAVRTWRFAPAQLRTLIPGKDLDGDGQSDYRVISDHTALRTYLDIRFTFSLVDGRGEVTFGTTD